MISLVLKKRNTQKLLKGRWFLLEGNTMNLHNSAKFTFKFDLIDKIIAKHVFCISGKHLEVVQKVV